MARAGKTSTGQDAITESVAAAFPSTIAKLTNLVQIPSVSAAAFDAANVEASAEAVATLARSLGFFDTVDIHKARVPGTDELGGPAVLARRAPAHGRPTVLLYAHHDVQPVGREDDWDSEPHVATLRDGRLYGRGVADDKGGVVAHLAAVQALMECNDTVDLGVVLFVEGEEESGSRSFASFLSDHSEALGADIIIVLDSDNWDTHTPAMTMGLRGNVTFTLTVSTMEHASHSGLFGGVVPDGMLAMIRLLASLHTDGGAVAVEGLAEAQVEVPEVSEEHVRRNAGLLDGVELIGEGPMLARMAAKPAITVTGMDVPSVSGASNTLYPTVSARISVRVAPGEDSGAALRAVEKHLRDNAPFGAHISIADSDAGSSFLADPGGWAAQEMKHALSSAWGRDAVDTFVGGSIPFVADLARAFPDAQILITGVMDPDSRAHAPNESLHLGVFKKAIVSEALFLHRLNARE